LLGTPSVVSSLPKEAPVHAYEIRICGLDSATGCNLARWELFACPEVPDLVKVAGRDRFLVLYEGEWDQHAVWCRVLENAGYEAEPIGRVREHRSAS
jgi:hypothetical protein